MRRAKPVRYIKPESIRIGDVIRVTYSDGDVTRTIAGKVASRQHNGAYTYYESAGEITILTVHNRRSENVTITLLEAAPELRDTPLAGMEN